MSLWVKKNLIGIAVETVSGTRLGKLSDIELDSDGGMVLGLEVRTSGLLPELFSGPLVVSRQHIVSISNEKIVVDDLTVKDKQPIWNKARTPAHGEGHLSSIEK